IKQPIYFKTAKAVIERRSFALLGTVATLMRLHPEIKKVRVEGHTDARGKHDYNVKLSQERANSVVAHLVLIAGIDPTRLDAEAFAPEKPVAPTSTGPARSLTRRVEFMIIERGTPGAAAPAPASASVPAAPPPLSPLPTLPPPAPTPPPPPPPAPATPKP